MKTTSIKTDKIIPKQLDIFSVLDKYLPDLEDGSILAITSKIVSICEGNVVKVGEAGKEELIKNEADFYLPPTSSKYKYSLTIKNNILLPASGIDESNSNGYFVLWPKDPQKSANRMRKYLIKRFGLKKVGVIITDSKVSPLRWGTTGVCIAHSGFKALNDYVGKNDIFGHKMQVTRVNVMDALATSSVLVMGEGQEQTPMALISNIPFVKFEKNNPTKKELNKLKIDIEDDLYAPILKSVKWQKRRARR